MPITVAEFERGLRDMRKRMDKIVLPSIRKHSKALSQETRKQIKRTPLGRKLFRRGGNVGRPGVKVLRAALSRSTGQFEGGIKIFGMARNIVTGERTRRHVIRAKRAAALAFLGSDGELRILPSVNHPGGRVTKRPVHERELKKIEKPFLRDVRKALEVFYSNEVAR